MVLKIGKPQGETVTEQIGLTDQVRSRGIGREATN